MNEASELYRLIWLSRPLMQNAEALVEKNLGGTGLSVRMRAVLEMLARHGDQTVPDLAFHLEIQRQYVQLMVNDVIAAGYAGRRDNPRHKRSRLISLTAEGRSVITGVMVREEAAVAELAQGFADGEVSAALAVMSRLSAAIAAKVREDRQ